MALILRANDFYQKLAANELHDYRSKDHVRENILINSEDLINGEYRVIKNIVFQANVLFENFDIISGLAFIDCDFRGGVTFRKITASKYDENFNKHNCNLFFSGCKISNLLIEEKSQLYRGLYIFSGTIIKTLSVKNSIIGNGGINIKESIIEEQLDLASCHIENVLIQYSTIKGIIRLDSIEANSCSFVKSTFEKWIQKWNCVFINLTFNDNIFEETVKISSSKITNTMTLSGDEFKKEFSVNFVDRNKVGELNKLYIKEAKFVSRLFVDGGNQTINLLNILFTSKLEGVVKFTNCSFSKTVISGINHNASLFFKSVKFLEINISDFNNHNSLTFSNSEGLLNSIFEIKDSDLGDTKFNDFSFANFSEIKIDYSLLNNILTSNIEWFNDDQLRFDNANTVKALRNKREIYIQLKNASSRQGNNIQSLEFKAREMKAYRNELRKSSNYSLGDRFIMAVSRSNSYGLDWIKPVGIIALLTLLCYLILVVIVSDNISILPSCSKEDWVYTINEFFLYSKALPQMFNPVRKLADLFPEKKLSFLVYSIDILHRVVLSIFIFQIISAFRKFFNK